MENGNTTLEVAPTPAGENQPPKPPSFELVVAIVRMLEPLPAAEQRHILQTAMTWLRLADTSAPGRELPPKAASNQAVRPTNVGEYAFSDRPEISPKEFLLEKDPKADVERATCLAYYLTHYRGQPFFKTEDLSKLNTEAAQRKFANAAFTAKNAARDGFFVQAPKKGLRQLSALGEQYVQALPDHEVARKVRKRMKIHGWRARSTTAEQRNHSAKDALDEQ